MQQFSGTDINISEVLITASWLPVALWYVLLWNGIVDFILLPWNSFPGMIFEQLENSSSMHIFKCQDDMN